jgi:hypothetical protein
MRIGAAPVRDPSFVGITPRKGEGRAIRMSGASPYMSANFAACLNISTNIFRVSFPVCVFWFDG